MPFFFEKADFLMSVVGFEYNDFLEFSENKMSLTF